MQVYEKENKGEVADNENSLHQFCKENVGLILIEEEYSKESDSWKDISQIGNHFKGSKIGFFSDVRRLKILLHNEEQKQQHFNSQGIKEKNDESEEFKKQVPMKIHRNYSTNNCVKKGKVTNSLKFASRELKAQTFEAKIEEDDLVNRSKGSQGSILESSSISNLSRQNQQIKQEKIKDQVGNKYQKEQQEGPN